MVIIWEAPTVSEMVLELFTVNILVLTLPEPKSIITVAAAVEVDSVNDKGLPIALEVVKEMEGVGKAVDADNINPMTSVVILFMAQIY
jgi:hypothetical protein